ncbi:MAG: hypothetical protein Q4E94_07470 [Clostridia bacterium]|nr:hypothetical protein [Clostridia bacterium]
MKKYISIKTVSLITAVALAVCALTGCGRETSDKDEQGRTILSIGNYPTQEGKSKETWDAKWQKFETDNPDVKIEPNQWTFDLEAFYAKAARGAMEILP